MHGQRRVRQLCLSCAMPLGAAELTELMHQLASNFMLEDSDVIDYSIALDPKALDLQTIGLIKGLGFNHIDLEVGDFQPQDRGSSSSFPSFAAIQRLMEEIRPFQFCSVGMDIFYGLPSQSAESIEFNLCCLLQIRPDRISCYDWGELPPKYKDRFAVETSQAPSNPELFQLICTRLQKAGYSYDGLNQFVLNRDGLAAPVSLQTGDLVASGTRTHNLIGLGVGAISRLEESFFANEACMSDYLKQIELGHLPISHGLRLTREDQLQHRIIQSICLRLQLDLNEIESEFGIHFEHFFSPQFEALRMLEARGLVFWEDRILYLRHSDRRALREVCALFADCQLFTCLSSLAKLF